MGASLPPHRPRVIKRYANRKLYDTVGRRYVTLQELAGLVEAGAELRVLDRSRGEDVTALVLAQLVLERIRRRSARIPGELLARLIRLGSAPVEAWREWPAPRKLAARVRGEAERIVSGLLGGGRISLDEALGLRQEIAASLQGLLREAQHGFEHRIHGLVERAEREGGVQPALRSFREQLLAFGAALRGGKRPPAAAPRRKRASRKRRQVSRSKAKE